MPHWNWCLRCDLRNTDTGCGKTSCVEPGVGKTPTEFVPRVGRPHTHKHRNGCHNCRHTYRMDEYQHYELFCHKDGSWRPLNGSSVDPDEQYMEMCRKMSFDDVVHVDHRARVSPPLWHNAVRMYHDAWTIWATDHKVYSSDTCDEWEERPEEVWEDE